MSDKCLIEKPKLSTAKRLFKRKNPSIEFKVSWKMKPVWTEGGYISTVEFVAPGYKPITMRLYSDAEGITIFWLI